MNLLDFHRGFFSSVFVVVLSFVFATAASGQLAYPAKKPDGGGTAPMPSDEITAEQRRQIWSEIYSNIERLQREGILQPASPQVTLFRWPLAKAPGIPDFNIEGISNYVDQNAGFPNQLQDFNCGTRTYDLSSGYNHQGIDMFTWPFGWKKMDDSAVHIVAAAAGTIISKSDGNFDRSCGFGGGNWNAVYVRHADNSVAWYGHMKNGSTTSKPVGATVVAGEYLGIVGSSGNSTGPHLHFEIYNTAGQLQEPYQGACNTLNNFTWWENQEPYRNSRMNRLMTHSAGPVFPSCPNPEIVSEKNFFRAGETFFTAGYFRDQILNQQTQYSLISPSGAVTNWSHNSPDTYSASYWFWSWNTSAAIQRGRWRLRAVFNGQEYNHYFVIGSTPFDYDGDSKADVSVYRPSGGSWWIRNSLNGSMYALEWGSGADRIAPADYDGDGKTDVAIFRPGTGQWWVLNSQTMSLTVHAWGIGTDIIAPGDYTGDGKADYVVWRPSDGGWYVKGSDGVDSATSWGVATDKPVAADYDGDGKYDLGIFRSDGNWWIRSSLTLGTIVRNLGIGTDKLVPADYTGDGKADVAIWRPADGGWWYLDSTTGAAVVRQWGIPTDIPAPADYDGNGKTDLAVFRSAEGNWWIFYDNNTTTAINWGTNGDQPTPNAYVR